MEHVHKSWYELIFKQRNMLIDASMMVLGAFFLALLSQIAFSAAWLYDILAQIRIPVTPVPITMQTFGVFALAFFFGARKGALTLLIYTALGLVGLGVFAKGASGLGVFIGPESLGPSGGYIIGFIFAALAVGYMIEKGYGRNMKSILGCLLVGEVIIYAFGLPWLWLALPNLTLWELLMAGLIPFIVGDIVKMLGAAALFPFLFKGAERINQAR